jgi:type II secretory pathway pseudopilin PulG
VLPGASRFVGLPPWVRIVPDGRGGEAVIWPHHYGESDGESEGEEEGEGEGERYWNEAHVYDDVGSSILLPGSNSSSNRNRSGSGSASAGRSASRPHGGLTREEGVILEHSGEAAADDGGGASGVWGAEDGQLGFGMTQARQRSIQGAVVSMMGGGGGSASASSSNRRRRQHQHQQQQQQQQQRGDAAIAAAAAEWACELCTLINAGRRARCEACGAGRPPIPRRSRSPSPVPPPQQQQPPPPAAGGGGNNAGVVEMQPPMDAVLLQPVPAGGGEEGKEEEAEEGKAADPNV